MHSAGREVLQFYSSIYFSYIAIIVQFTALAYHNIVINVHYSIFLVAHIAQVNYKCPKPDGLFPDASFCDKYYDCFDDIAEVRQCPDGLVFDPLSRKREPCDHYFNVDCEDRLQLRK